jgi:hypothetical protein
MASSVITPAMRDAVGSVMRRSTSFPVSESDIRRWAIAVYYPEPAPRQFWDREFASSRDPGGIFAPEEFNPFAWMVATSEQADVSVFEPDYIEKSVGIAGPGLKFTLNGGAEIEYGVRMRPGDVVTSVFTLAGYHEREGRLGLMLFTKLEDLWTNQRGEIVKRYLATSIRY